MKLNELKLNPDNPRTISKEAFERLKEKIKRNPNGLRVHKILHKDGVIVAGNQRFRALQDLGLELKDEWFDDATGWSDEQIKEWLVTSNVSDGAWDWDILANQYELEDLEAWGVELPTELKGEDGVEEDEAPEVSKEPAISQLGEIYQLGRHRLMCGDSTDKEAIAQLLDGAKPELLFTDPPYNFETQGGGVLKNSKQMNEVKANSVDKFDPINLEPQAKTNIYFHNKSLIGSYSQLAEVWEMPYDLAIYKKRGLPNYSGHLMTDVEYIAIIGNLDPNKGFDMSLYSKVFEGNKDADNELSYSKPIELCAKFIKLYSKTSVLDTYGGSGSTLIACEQLDRTCYMMELDPKYCDVIRKRYWKFVNDGNEEGWEENTPAIASN